MTLLSLLATAVLLFGGAANLRTAWSDPAPTRALWTAAALALVAIAVGGGLSVASLIVAFEDVATVAPDGKANSLADGITGAVYPAVFGGLGGVALLIATVAVGVRRRGEPGSI